MSATSIDLSQIKTDALSAASTFRTLIGLGTSDTPTFKAATLSAGTLNGTVLDISQTWGGTGTYTGIKYNVTDSGPANSASLLLDLQVGGNSKFKVSKNGDLVVANPSVMGAAYFNGTNYTATGSNPGLIRLSANNISFMAPGGVSAGSTFNWSSLLNISFYEIALLTGVTASQGIQCEASNSFKWASQSTWGSPDLFLYRDAANTLAQRNSTNAQTFRIYNTFTDANNYERAKIAWESNVLRIGTEGLGTGAVTPRSMEFQTAGTTRLTIGTDGVSTFNNVVNSSSYRINGSDIAAEATILTRLGLRLGGGGYSVVRLGGVYQSNNTIILIGGEGSSFPAIKRNSAALNFRLADDSADCDITAKAVTFSGNVTVSAVNLVTDTATGTKIGTATNQKLGFFNSTPVVQPAAVADATDAASVITQLNLLLARMRDLGLIAT